VIGYLILVCRDFTDFGSYSGVENTFDVKQYGTKRQKKEQNNKNNGVCEAMFYSEVSFVFYTKKKPSFYFSVYSLLVSIEMIYQTLETEYYGLSKHLEISSKILRRKRLIFNFLVGFWISR